MPRDNRIKTLKFQATISATTTGVLTFDSNFSNKVINGEILEVNWSHNNTGSLFLTVSGTGEEVFRRNAPSGTGVQVTRPRAVLHDKDGAVAVGSPWTPYVVHDMILVNAAGMASGTQPLTVNVLYR